MSIREREGRTEFVDGGAHLVELFGADVGAIGEAEVDEGPFSEQVLVGEGLALVRGEGEGPADLGAADGLVLALLACIL